MGTFEDAFVKLFESFDRPEYREKMARKGARNAGRLASNAIALDEEETRCIEAVNAFAERDMPAEERAAKTRAMLVHKARCSALAQLAQQLSLTMKWALGNLRIDETTDGTGLAEDERALINLITNAGVEL
jgi:hypothetical protein